MKLETAPACVSRRISKYVPGFFSIKPLGVLAVLLIAFGTCNSVQAADDPLGVIRKLAKEGVKCPVYVETVVKLVKAFPKQTDEIIAEAVKNQPPCACEIIKAGIAAVTPENGTPDPKQVATMVALVVQYIQSSNPELLETIVACATEAAPDAGPMILTAISQVFGTTAGANKQSMVGPGIAASTASPSPTATPTPTPPSTPIPVTPVVPP